MRKVKYTTKEERYFDCPHCGTLITDDGGEGIEAGLDVECENCHKKIHIWGEE